MYKQLTLAQRYTISTMRQNGSSLQAIADELNRLREEEAALKGETPPVKKIAASTISRELNKAQYQINERPRKKLNFSSPKIEFYRRIC